MLPHHPQVEFPEARIYEETLNILLYERESTNHTTIITTNTSSNHTDNGGGGEFSNNRGQGGHNCQSDDELDSHRVRRIHVNSNRPV